MEQRSGVRVDVVLTAGLVLAAFGSGIVVPLAVEGAAVEWYPKGDEMVVSGFEVLAACLVEVTETGAGGFQQARFDIPDSIYPSIYH